MCSTQDWLISEGTLLYWRSCLQPQTSIVIRNRAFTMDENAS